MAYALCDFVDAGNGKECSDHKLKGTSRSTYLNAVAVSARVNSLYASLTLLPESFKLNIADVHCKHIIFGGSADNGYARLLTPYSSNDADSSSITMLEGPPFAAELVTLANKFKVASFNDVFRVTKLQVRGVSFSQSGTAESGSTRPLTPAVMSTYASAAMLAGKLSATEVAAPLTVDLGDSENKLIVDILKNSRGLRIDSPLRPVEALVKLLKAKKYCNPFHLRGDCPFQASRGHCDFIHGERLKDKHLVALRYIARLTVCDMGSWCDDKTCLAGHQCPNKNCRRGNECKFSREMHWCPGD